jgi:hypothetical protein
MKLFNLSIQLSQPKLHQRLHSCLGVIKAAVLSMGFVAFELDNDFNFGYHKTHPKMKASVNKIGALGELATGVCLT